MKKIHFFKNKKIYFLLFFFLLFFIQSNLNAQQIYKIEDILISGNKTISNKEILEFLNLKIGENYLAEQLINLDDKISNWGYFSSINLTIEENSQKLISDENSNIVNSENRTKSIIIKIEVTENLPVKVILIKNSNIYLSSFKSKMKLKENKAFNPKYLEKDIEILSKYPYVSRVISSIMEEQDSISIEINLILQNQFSSEIVLSKFLIGSFNYFFGKSFIPFYFSIFSFYPYDSENYYPIIGTSTGFSFLPGFYFNINFISFYSSLNNKFIESNLLLGLTVNKYISKEKNFVFLLNPCSIFLSYNIEKNIYEDLSFSSDSFIKIKNNISIFSKMSFSYFFQQKEFFFGNIPNNGLNIDLIYNKNYYTFFYSSIFNSFSFRSEPYQISEISDFVLSSSSDIVFKIINTQILYLGLIGSFDFLFINKSNSIFKYCYGLGIVFSFSIKNILELPITIQYFWKKSFENGVFYFTFLSRRFSF